MPRAGDEDGEDDLEDSGTEPDVSDLEDGELAGGVGGDDEVENALDFAESDDDLLASDAELPDGLFDPDGEFSSDSEATAEEWGGVDANTGKKRKSSPKSKHSFGEGDGGKDRKKRKIKHLPTFASLEDYERLIDQTPADNI